MKLATTLKNRVIPWVNRDEQRFDLILQALSCVFFFWLFYLTPQPSGPVTHDKVRATVFLGCIFFWELYAFTMKLRRYVDRHKNT